EYRPNIEYEFVFILNVRRQPARASYDVWSYRRRTEQRTFSEVVCELRFIRVRPHSSLRKPEIAGKACIGIRLPRLKMIIPAVVSADLEVLTDEGSASNAEYLAAFEIADAGEIAGPDIPGIRINFSDFGERRDWNGCYTEKDKTSKHYKL